MGDEEARPLAADEPLLKPHHRVEVEVVGRLVEEQQVRAAHQGLREVEPDPPPAREVRDGASEVFRVEPEAVEDPSRPRLRGVAVDGLELRVERGEAPVVALALGRLDAALHRTERPVAVHRPVEGGGRARLGLLGEVGDGPAPRDPDVTLLGQEASPKEEEEARLADPVPPHDTGAMARVHDEVEPREQGRRASLEGDVREVDHRRGGLGGGGIVAGSPVGSLPAGPLPGAAPPRPRECPLRDRGLQSARDIKGHIQSFIPKTGDLKAEYCLLTY